MSTTTKKSVKKHGRYIPIGASEVPDGILWQVPGANQGQIVEVAYGSFSRAPAGWGDPYRRTTDRSDNSVTYERYEADGNTPPITWE